MQTKYFYAIVFLIIGAIFTTGFIGREHAEEVELLSVKLPVNNTFSMHDDLLKDYDGFLHDYIDSTNNVGAAVAIINNDSVIYLNTFGVRAVNSPDSVDENTIFRLASVSKGFAGVLACILNRDSVLSLDQKIIDVIPGFQLKDSASTNTLTVEHTLNHTSGLVPHAFDNLVEDGVPMAQIIRSFKDVDIADKPGKVYSYQNAMFSMIDTVLRVTTEKAYSEHLNEKIFIPLNMQNASATQIVLEETPNVALPHVLAGGRYVARGLNKRYYSAAPAAGVNASISDMSKWLKALLGANPEILDSSVMSRITTPTIYTPLKRKYTARWGKVANRQYSIGWRIYNYFDHNIIYHGGYVKGYRAEIAFCPEENTGIVFLQNSPNRLSSMSVPEFWKRYFAHKETTNQARQQILNARQANLPARLSFLHAEHAFFPTR